jgi:hypothetical protein
MKTLLQLAFISVSMVSVGLAAPIAKAEKKKPDNRSPAGYDMILVNDIVESKAKKPCPNCEYDDGNEQKAGMVKTAAKSCEAVALSVLKRITGESAEQSWTPMGDKVVLQSCENRSNDFALCRAALYRNDGTLIKNFPGNYKQKFLANNLAQTSTSTEVIPLLTDDGSELRFISADSSRGVVLESAVRNHFSFSDKVLVHTRAAVHIYSDKAEEITRIDVRDLPAEQFVRHAVTTRDGYALVTANDTNTQFSVLFYNRSGRLLERVHDSGRSDTPPAVLRNGNIVIRQRSIGLPVTGKVKVYSSSGKVLSSLQLSEYIYANFRSRDTLPLDAEKIYIFGEDAKVYAVDAPGESKVIANTSTVRKSSSGDVGTGGASSDPILLRDGRKAFFAEKNMVVVDKNGSVAHRSTIPHEIVTNAVLLPDNNLLVTAAPSASDRSIYYVLSDTGKILGTFTTPDYPPDAAFTPIVLKNGNLILKDEQQNTYFVNMRAGAAKGCGK